MKFSVAERGWLQHTILYEMSFGNDRRVLYLVTRVWSMTCVGDFRATRYSMMRSDRVG